jgi:aminopeptidase N
LNVVLALTLAFSLTAVGEAAEGPPLPHLDISLNLDPAQRTLAADAILSVRGGNTLTVLLGEAFKPDGISLNGRPITAPSRIIEGQRGWRIPLKPGDNRIKLAYRGRLEPMDTALDHRQVLHRLPPMAGAEGVYLPSGSGWYPETYQLFSYRLKLRLPRGQIGVAPGELVRESTGAQGYEAEFDFPQSAEGIELMAGPYAVSEKMAQIGGGTLRLRTYFHRELNDLADAYLKDTEAYLRLYTDWIGPYPYAGFSIVSSPLPTGFGLPGLTYLGRQVLRLPFIRATSLGHEVLHNWWGNGVYPDWQSGNWSEGLTTFMADYAYKERESEAAAKAMRHGWLADFAAMPPEEDRPLTAFTARTHTASSIVGYGKTAMLFYMLREKIGKAAFDRGLRHFWRENRFRRAGWTDLRVAFEKASGEDLDYFFRQWLNRTGAPRLKLNQARLVSSASPWKLEVTLAQSHPSHELDVPLLIRTKGGGTKHTVRIGRSLQTVVIELSEPPQAVRLDPDFEIWRDLSEEETPAILRQLMIAARPRLHLAGEPAFQRAAQGLVPRLLEGNPQPYEAKIDEPLLIIVPDAEAGAVLKRLELPPVPASLKGRGTARVWATRNTAGQPIMVVSAKHAEALSALSRGLPHYGRQSWLVFEGGKAVDKGIWPVEEKWVAVGQ